MSFRAPEVYLGYPATSALDIWSLGCLVSISPCLKTLAPTTRLDNGAISKGLLARNWRRSFRSGLGWGGIDRETGITWDIEEAQLRDMTDRLKTNIPIEMRERSQYWNKYLDEYGQ